MDPHDVSRSDSTACDEILTLHSDYLDGLLAAHEAARIQWHLSQCTSCARYDRIVRRSLDMVRELPEVQPSDDFEERLQHRIYHVQDGEAIAEPRAAGGAAALAVASVIALLAWSPLMFSERDGEPAAAVVAASPEREVRPATQVLDVLPATPLLGSAADVWFPVPQLSPLAGSDIITTLVSFPGPYSPLTVEPPVHGRSVRTISAGYSPVD